MKNNEDEKNVTSVAVKTYSVDTKWNIAASIVTMICAIISAIVVKVNSNFIIGVIVTLLVAFTLLLIFFYRSISIRKQTESERNMETINDLINQKHENEIKDLCTALHSYVHKVRDWICSSNIEIDNEQMLHLSCSQTCDIAEKAFNLLWNNKYTVSVCIKQLIKPPNTDYEDWQIKTVARSIGTDMARENNENAKTEVITVRDNTDFRIILKPGTRDTLFACADLEKINENFKSVYSGEEYKGIDCYANTTENYTAYYRATIVVPIRIVLSKTQATYKFDNDVLHHVVGFLCVDTKEPFTDGDVLFAAGGEMAKIFADSIYKLFEDNIVYSNKNNEKISN